MGTAVYQPTGPSPAPRHYAHGVNSGTVSRLCATAQLIKTFPRGARQPPSVSAWTFVKSVLLADSELARLTHTGDIARVAMPPGRSQSPHFLQGPGAKGSMRTWLSEIKTAGWDGLAAEGKTSLLTLMKWLL